MNSNLERTMQALDAWNRHNLDGYRTLYAPDARTHGFAPVPVDVDTLMQIYRGFYAGFPDIHLEVVTTVADEERVAVHFRVLGTHTGEFQGIPATGKSINIAAMSIMHFRDGAVVERWSQTDQMGMLQQLGVIPA